jgi:predicted phosphodiesterase
MTRLAILADIHGNLPALEAIIADMAQYTPDAVVVAGDLINIAPFSAEVLARVFALGAAAIRGNHEFYMLDYQTPREPAHWRDFTTPRWLRATLSGDLQRRVAAMPDTLTLYYLDSPPLRVLHGLPHTHWDGMYPSTTDAAMAAHLAPVREETVIVGHVHLQQERHVVAGERCWHIINPGAAGQPLDGQPGSAPYAILDGDADGWRATFCRARYDNSGLLDAMESTDYRAAHGAFMRLYTEEFRVGRVRLWAFQRWRAACHPGADVTEALVDAFFALGDVGMQAWIPEDFRY